MSPREMTNVLVAFCERSCPEGMTVAGGGLETSGDELRDQFGLLARWNGHTRVELNADRAEWPPMNHIEKFLDYWCSWKIIGVSTRPFKKTQKK